MRILALSYGLDESHGWGRYGAELLRELQARGDAAVTLAERASELSDPSLDVRRVLPRLGHDDPFEPAGALQALRFATLARRFDLIHALDESKLSLGVALAALSGRPLAATLHGTYAIKALERRPGLAKALFGRVGAPIANSGYTRARVAALAPAFAARTTVVPLGVRPPTSAAPPPPAAGRSAMFLSVGAVKRRKGVLESLHAVAAARRIAPEVRLVVAGGYDEADPYVSELRRAARGLGAEDVLVLLGRVSEAALDRLYATARGLIMPSQNSEEGFEGFGLVHLEAAQRGLPSIGSRDCGNEDAVRDGQTGILVAQGDALALEAAVLRLLADDAAWDAMSKAGQVHARKMDWATTAERTQAAYRAAAGRSGGAGAAGGDVR